MSSSMTVVRTIIGHANARPRGMALTIASPRSPASVRANGSRKCASGRAVSMAR